MNDKVQPMEPLLTVEEVAKLLNCSEQTVRNLIRDNHLPAVRIAPKCGFRVRPSDLRAMLARRAVKPDPAPEPIRTGAKRAGDRLAREIEAGLYDGEIKRRKKEGRWPRNHAA